MTADNPLPTDEQMRAGSVALLQLARMAFAPEWCRWTPLLNCAAVEWAWNATPPREEHVPRLGAGDADLRRLLRTLARARTCRWPRLTCRVDDLAVRVRNRKGVFCFRLSFDGGTTFRSCEATVPLPAPTPAGNPLSYARLPTRCAGCVAFSERLRMRRRSRPEDAWF